MQDPLRKTCYRLIAEREKQCRSRSSRRGGLLQHTSYESLTGPYNGVVTTSFASLQPTYEGTRAEGRISRLNPRRGGATEYATACPRKRDVHCIVPQTETLIGCSSSTLQASLEVIASDQDNGARVGHCEGSVKASRRSRSLPEADACCLKASYQDEGLMQVDDARTRSFLRSPLTNVSRL